MPTSKSSSRKTIASVQRALDILNLFNNEQTELGNTEIAKLVNLPVGTASGLIYTLKVNNYLDQNPTNRKYHLGLKLAERASVLLDALDLRKIAAPYLESLRDWSGESINLAVRDGNEVVYIERIFGNHSLGIRSELGKRGPLHSTALGKAIISHLPETELLAFIAGYHFFQVTPHTITSADQFAEEARKVKRNGFAVDEQENELGGRCIAAPIFDMKGYPVAAISVSVPIQRLPDKDVEEFGLKVKTATLSISQEMGYMLERPNR